MRAGRRRCAWSFGRAWLLVWLVVTIARGWRGGLSNVLSVPGWGGFFAMGFVVRSIVLILRETVMAVIMANAVWFHSSPFVFGFYLF